MDTRELSNKEGQDFVAPKTEGGEQRELSPEAKNEAVFNKIKALTDENLKIEKANELASIIRGDISFTNKTGGEAIDANNVVIAERASEMEKNDNEIDRLKKEYVGNIIPTSANNEEYNKVFEDLQQKINDYRIPQREKMYDQVDEMTEALKNVK